MILRTATAGGRRQWKGRRARLKRMAPPWASREDIVVCTLVGRRLAAPSRGQCSAAPWRNVNIRATFNGTTNSFVVFLLRPPTSTPMSRDDEDRFRLRPGRIRSDRRGSAATKSFFTRVRKIARQHGAGPPGASAHAESNTKGRASGKVGAR